MVELIIDPEFESLIPPLTDDEFKQLSKNILEVQEVYDPLIVWNGILVDGHNRWKIIQKNPEVKYKTTEVIFFNRNEAKLWIIRNQLGRRNLPDYEKARLALRLKDAIAAEAKEKQGERTDIHQKSDKSPINTNKELAKVAGVSHDTIHKVDVIEKRAPEEVKEQLRRGEVSINKAYNEIRSVDTRKQKPVIAIDLASEINDISTAFVTTVRAALTSHSTLLTEENKPQILESLARAKSRIEEIEKLLK